MELGAIFYWKRTNKTQPRTYHKELSTPIAEPFATLYLPQEVESVVEIGSDSCTEENLIQNQTVLDLEESSNPMESDSEVEVVGADAKEWEDDWPITDHNIFLEIQMKVEMDAELRATFVSNNNHFDKQQHQIQSFF